MLGRSVPSPATALGASTETPAAAPEPQRLAPARADPNNQPLTPPATPHVPSPRLAIRRPALPARTIPAPLGRLQRSHSPAPLDAPPPCVPEQMHRRARRAA